MDITSYLLGKKKGGGGGTGDKYAPKFILFTKYTGTDLTYETQNLDTSNLTTTEEMFKECTNLQTIDLTGWNTSKVTNMSYMFQNCLSLTSLDLSSFNTSKVTNMTYMFNISGTDHLGSIVFGQNWDTSKVTNMSYMFKSNTLSSIDFTKFNFSSVIQASNFISNVIVNKLSNDDLNNLLGALITATNIETKTMKYLGLGTSTANRCKTLSNWPALEQAGWTTG